MKCERCKSEISEGEQREHHTVDLEEKDLEREITALRHMEKVRGELKDGKKRIRLW